MSDGQDEIWTSTSSGRTCMCEEFCVPKIIDWKLLADQHVDGLNEQVSRYIGLGWEPIGDCFTLNGGYRQAVILYSDSVPSKDEQIAALHGLLIRWTSATQQENGTYSTMQHLLRQDTEAAIRGCH